MFDQSPRSFGPESRLQTQTPAAEASQSQAVQAEQRESFRRLRSSCRSALKAARRLVAHGHTPEAIDALREVEPNRQSAESQPETLRLQLELARLLRHQGLAAEARSLQQNAQRLFDESEYPQLRFELILGHAEDAILADELDTACTLVQLLVRWERLQRNQRHRAWIESTWGYLHARRGDWHQALRWLTNAVQRSARTADPVQLRIGLDRAAKVVNELDRPELLEEIKRLSAETPRHLWKHRQRNSWN